MTKTDTINISPILEGIFKEHGLSVREIKVATLLATEGLSNKEIAKRISCTSYAIKFYTGRIYRKFAVKGRVQLMAVILRNCCILEERIEEETIEKAVNS